MSKLSGIAGRVSEAAGGRIPKACLWVGVSEAFAEALAGVLAQSGKSCAFYTLETSVDARKTAIENAYAFAGPAVPVREFPKLNDVIAFAQTRADPAAASGAFTAALGAARKSGARPALDALAEDFQARTFDLVVIAGETILTERIVRRAWGSRAFLINATKTTYGGAAAYAALFADTGYMLAASDDAEEGGWALFVLRNRAHATLPIHFFTIVLNGEPFIRYHEKMLLELDCPWHWHVVEGVASLVKDTAWSVAAGGHIPADLHARGKSNDGTTEYLDELARRYPNRVTLYRKPPDVFWDGKLEMVSAPIPQIKESCLLWQIDSDELWTAEQVETVRRKFIENPERGAAYFWCNYYVGPEKGISTRYNYAQNPKQEWLRVWRFEPGMIWDKHEPPVLAGFDANNVTYDVGQKAPFTHREMEACGAVFDHFAYCTPEQAQFKESYYGYKNAVAQWRALQAHGEGSGHLKDYFAWVSDDTMFDSADHLGWTPLAFFDAATSQWRFRDGAELRAARQRQVATRKPRIVVDGVFFQLAGGGISRLWVNLLKEWTRSGFGEQVVVLDRAGTMERINGVIYHSIDRHSWDTIDGDAAYLQEICDRLHADLFLSTYYTTPTRTPTVFMGYDMIPEALGFDLDDLWWRQKRRAIQYAVGRTTISQSSAREMTRFHPDLTEEDTLVAYCSVDPHFCPCEVDEIEAFRHKYGIDRDFVMLVGERFGWKGYKNGAVVFAALAQLPRDRRPLLVCVGGAPQLEDVGRAFLGEEDVRLLKLDDADLRACYGAAFAYICPSSLEGFGLPIAEAMTVGCPALVCRNSSIPEVAGDAGIYFDANDPGSLIAALDSVRDPARRAAVVAAGRTQAAKFDQARSARMIADYCLDVIGKLRSGAIRVNAQALADAFKDAEARRAAEVGAATLEKALFDVKVELSALSRIQPIASAASSAVALAASAPNDDHVIQTGATRLDQYARQMIAIERRLATAYARLRAPGRVSDESVSSLPVAPAPQIHAPIELLETIGLSGLEGPYPDLQIARRFRWQTQPRSLFAFECADACDALLEIELGNVEPDQIVRVFLGDTQVTEARPTELGWPYLWRIALPVTLVPGLIRVAVEADRCAQIEADSRSLYVAIYAVRFRPRRTETAPASK